MRKINGGRQTILGKNKGILKILYEYYTASKFSFLRILPNLLLIVIPLLLSFPKVIGYLNNSTGIIIISLIIIGIVIFDQREILRSQSYKEKNGKLNIMNENLTATIVSLPEDYTRYLFEELELNNKERISLYIFDENHFTMVSRWSNIHNLKEEGRGRYPIDEGFISQVWNGATTSDHFHISRLCNPDEDFNQYVRDIQEKVNMPVEKIEILSMKSRSYFVKLLRENVNNAPIGILVIESLSSNLSISVTDLNNKLDGMPAKFLSKLLEINSR